MMVCDGITIDAGIDEVWAVFIDVARWPEWTASVTSLTPVIPATPAPEGRIAPAGTTMADSGFVLRVGAAVRIKQPRFPRLTWTVTAVDPGVSWTWVSTSPGATTVASHQLTALAPTSTRVEQSIEQHGVVGVPVGRLTARLTRRYLAMEAAGLKARVEGHARKR